MVYSQFKHNLIYSVERFRILLEKEDKKRKRYEAYKLNAMKCSSACFSYFLMFHIFLQVSQFRHFTCHQRAREYYTISIHCDNRILVLIDIDERLS